jgi:hypothetical protein
VNATSPIKIIFVFVTDVLFLFVTTQQTGASYCLDLDRQADCKLALFGSWYAFAGGILHFSLLSHMFRANEEVIDFKVGDINSIQDSARNNLDWISDVLKIKQKFSPFETPRTIGIIVIL